MANVLQVVGAAAVEAALVVPMPVVADVAAAARVRMQRPTSLLLDQRHLLRQAVVVEVSRPAEAAVAEAAVAEAAVAEANVKVVRVEVKAERTCRKLAAVAEADAAKVGVAAGAAGRRRSI